MSRTANNKVSIRFHQGACQWCTSIGKKWSKDKSRLVQAVFYLGDDEAKARLEASRKKEEWRHLVANWGKISLDVFDTGFPSTDKPFWFESDKQETATAQRDREWAEGLRDINLEQKSESFITLGKAIALYHAEKKLSVKPNTYLDLTTTLTSAMKIGDIFDGKRPLNGFQASDIKTYLLTLKNWAGLAHRTKQNYAKHLKCFFNWLADDERFEAFKPRGMEKAFGDFFKTLQGASPLASVPSDTDIKALLDNANSRNRLFCLLALNCGMTATDIGHLKQGSIKQEGDKTYCVWQREKTLNQNRDLVLNTLLWPETIEAIESHKAGENEYGLMFLTSEGKPLEGISTTGKTCVSGIHQSFFLLARKSKVKTSHKFLRKYGASWIAGFDTIDTSNYYLGHKVKGVNAFYIKQSQERLERALLAFHQHLKGKGIL